MSRISDLMLEGGRAKAQGALARGQAWDAGLNAAAGFLPGVRARNQADADRESKQWLVDSQLRTDTLQQQNAQGDMDARAAAAKAAGVKARNLQWSMNVARAPTPELASQFFTAGLERGQQEGWLDPDDVAALTQYSESGIDPREIAKAGLSTLLPGETFARMFPEQKAPGTREVKVRNADGSETIQVVEDKPGQSFTSAAEPEKTVTFETVDERGRPVTKVVPQSQAVGQSFPKYVAPTQGAQPTYEWVQRAGQWVQIAKGKAQPGDVPESVASKQAPPAGAQSPYGQERNVRVRTIINRLLGGQQADGTTKPAQLGNMNTGIIGMATSNLPATPARKLRGDLEELKANIGFNELTEMREASKTGGALGNVSDTETRLLSSTLGSLDQFVDDKDLAQRLRQIEASLDRWDAAKAQYGGGQAPRVAPAASHGSAAGGLSVTAPNGKTYTFQSQGEMEAFKRNAGIR